MEDFNMYITEPEKRVPVVDEADLFVAGGSCTGVFAAIRAARLGLKVVLAERQNCLGGTATAALVNIWHSFKDIEYKEQIIAGLSYETAKRMEKNGDAELYDKNPSGAVTFNPYALSYELDKMVKEEKITVYLHTLCVGAVTDGKKIKAALIENKDGRGAVKAKFYIDATGDGDLAARLGLKSYKAGIIQPPTPCFLMQGRMDGVNLGELLEKYGKDYGLVNDFGWSSDIPGIDGLTMMAYFHVFGEDAETAKGLTNIEMGGRKNAFELCRIVNEHTNKKIKVAALSSYAGIRESRHFTTKYMGNAKDLLFGKKFDDTIIKGTYRVDVHNKDGSIVHKYLDGKAMSMAGAERKTLVWNWREEEKVTEPMAKYYSVPFEIIVQSDVENFIAAGRMINADIDAFGALRVMVNLNQMGEAAGVASYVCINENKKIDEIDGKIVTNLLRRGGSAL